ncbi:9068_t:CDS:2, partial [Scutellospora calospora]
VYPPEPDLAHTLKPNCYPIPDKYIIETTYGKDKKTVICHINYIAKHPHYKIIFGPDEDDFICSNLSPTAAANNYLKFYNQNKKHLNQIPEPESKSKMNGVHLFGLQLKQLRYIREKQREKIKIKPFADLTNRMQIIRNKNMGINLFLDFKNQIKHNYHLQDNVKLQELTFSVNESKFHIKYDQSKELENALQIAIIKEIDTNHITRAAYRTLSAIEHNLPRESAISARKKQLNDEMIAKGDLDLAQSTIKIRISRDSHNVGYKVKQVMVTFAILNSKFNIYKPSLHFTLILYSGTEKYEILKADMSSLIKDLDDIKNGFQQIAWNITISKDIDDICQNYVQRPGHQYALLFSMIPICNYVVDELHLMLCIWDRLWTLAISELCTTCKFTEEIRQEIINEMNHNKLKVLRNFNLNTMFVSQRAAIIRKLWDGFNELYEDIYNPNITGIVFHEKARKWLELFLTRSQGNVNSVGFTHRLYQPTDITPYIHVLIYYVLEFIDKHHDIGFTAFSCSGVEKKNHNHISHFFQKMMKGEGKEEIRKPAIMEIMEYENQYDFFYVNNISSYFEKDTTININIDELH